jgi:Putative S-adenosyl-L-methionine-dependent methyltransferase
MYIELRTPDERLRGPKAVDAAPVLSSVVHAARDAVGTDLTRLRVVCDWIQYKQNFRDPVGLRLVEPWPLEAARVSRNGGGAHGDHAAWEIAIDLRRADASLDDTLRSVLAGADDGSSRVALETWGPGSRSLIWGFNTLYWKALSLWEQATGRGYEQALPGGESDARNVAAARELVLELFAVWDRLAERRALPEELHVLELGVGNGNQARVWLDEFRRLDREMGREYYRRLHYLMGDYSPHLLDLARKAIAQHAEKVSSLVLDAMRPTETLGFLRYKAFLVYISNVYDNLPTDEIARIGGHLYQVEVRAVLPRPAAERIAADLPGVQPDDLPDLVSRLLRLGPELLAEALSDRFPRPADAVAFWRALWAAVRLDERYIPLEALDTYDVAPGISGELLRPIALSAGDVRMHVSNGAAASFTDTLPLLHPLGVLQCHDLFVTDILQYTNNFRGPGKYDGSVVNWVNGPMLAAIGSRRGFDVDFQPFAHRTGANVLTMTARSRD